MTGETQYNYDCWGVSSGQSISVYKGFNPDEVTLLAMGVVAFGPLACWNDDEKIGILKCIIPRVPGTHSPFGLLTSDIDRPPIIVVYENHDHGRQFLLE